MGHTKTCVYQFNTYQKDSDVTQITKYFIIHVLGLCIKVYSYVAHMFNAWSFSNNKAVKIAIKKKKYLLYLNINTTIFAWKAGNSNKNIM